jgi:septum formation protein
MLRFREKDICFVNIILASESPYRRQQLTDFGLLFSTAKPAVDEDQLKVSALKKKSMTPVRLAQMLAEAKAYSLAEQNPEAAIIGADQLIALKKQIFGKPGNREAAIQQLQKLNGKTHLLITAVAVAAKNKVRSQVVVAKIKMRKLSRDEILASIYRDNPIDCAGSYKLERSGLSLVEKITVSDPSALVGLPLVAMHRLLRSFKEPLPFRS